MKILAKLNPIYIRFYPHFKKYVKLIIICMLFSSVVSAASALLPWFLKQIIDELFVKKEFQRLLPIMFFLTGLVIILNIFNFLEEFFMEKVRLSLSIHLRTKMIENIYYKKLAFFKSKHSGELVSLFNYDLTMAENMPNLLARICFEFPVQIIMLFVAMLHLNSKLAFFVLLVAPPTYIIMRKSKKYRRALSHLKMTLYGKIYTDFQEYLSGIKIIKGWNLAEYCQNKFAQNYRHFMQQSLKEVKYNAVIKSALELVIIIIINIILYVAVEDIKLTGATPGDYAGFIMAAWLFLRPLQKIGAGYSSLINASVAAERILEILEDNNLNEVHLKEGALIKSIHKIDIIDATYGYNGNMILEKVNMTFEPSRINIIMGANGTGKTTIIESILGFIEPEVGKILFNGMPIEDYNISALRSRISFISQDIFLFNQTIRDNITFSSNLADGETKNKYQWALRAAGVDQLLDAHGREDSGMLAERGSNFSGGEKQCICLARALFKDHDVLILDEANSNISKDIFKEILEMLNKHKNNKIIIFITHDNTYWHFADIIYEISNNTVIRKRI